MVWLFSNISQTQKHVVGFKFVVVRGCVDTKHHPYDGMDFVIMTFCYGFNHVMAFIMLWRLSSYGIYHVMAFIMSVLWLYLWLLWLPSWHFIYGNNSFLFYGVYDMVFKIWILFAIYLCLGCSQISFGDKLFLDFTEITLMIYSYFLRFNLDIGAGNEIHRPAIVLIYYYNFNLLLQFSNFVMCT